VKQALGTVDQFDDGLRCTSDLRAFEAAAEAMMVMS